MIPIGFLRIIIYWEPRSYATHYYFDHRTKSQINKNVLLNLTY